MFEDILPKQIAMIYAILAVIVIGILFYRNKFNRKIGYIFLVLSALFGFLLFAPMLPMQLQELLSGSAAAAGTPIRKIIIGLGIFIIFTLIAGRIFCGYVCPIGALQEFMYLIPFKKIKIKKQIIPSIFRIIFFTAIIIWASFFSVEILTFFGIKQFFHLEYNSIFFFSFVLILLTSILIYRVFCQFFCPFGLLLSLTSVKRLYKFQRNDNCTNCKACEKACPTNESFDNSIGMECYMCNRCVEICRFDSIDYDKCS